MTKIGQHVVRVLAVAGLCAAGAGAAFADDSGLVAAAPPASPSASTSTIEALLRTVDQKALGRGEDAAAARARILEALRASNTCFIENPSQEQLDYIERTFSGKPPAMLLNRGIANRFLPENVIWFGVAPAGDPASTYTVPASGIRPAAAIKLTYSFPGDGIAWDPADSTHVNDLNAQLTRVFTLERGRELIRQGLAAWRVSAGIRYEEVADNDEPLNTGPATSPAPQNVGHGDIRIGAFAQDAINQFGSRSPVLAYNNPPGLGGDMTINSNYFLDPTPNGLYGNSTASGFLLFRNAIAHEHGHGLGLMHVVPCDQTKLMEPFNSTRYDGPQVDDLRGIQEDYGDRLTPNQSPTQADVSELANFGTLIDTTGANGSSILIPNLSTNGPYQRPDQSINPSGADWFKFRFDSPSAARITARPARVISGSTFYQYGPLTSMCVLMGNTVEQYLRAGNLNVEVYAAADPLTPIATSASHMPGQAGEILFATGAPLPPGDYLVRVYDSGGDAPSPTRPIQLYDLEIRVGDPALGTTSDQQFAYKPIAVAGINKRVLAGQPVQFIGDLLSSSQEPDNAPVTSGFEWDITGPNNSPGADGVFEITNHPPMGSGITATPTSPPNLLREPVFAGYNTNGVFPVRLRVTDSSGQSSIDTIFVTVVGAPMTVTSVDPSSGQRGFSVPVTINGTGLGGITQASQITFSMPGDITVTGTPVATDTQITGLTLVIANNATLGAHDLTITDGVANAMLTGAFTVIDTPRPVNDECEGAVHWDPAPLMCFPLPHNFLFDNRGASRSSVPSALGSVLCDNGGMYNDVWYFLRSEDLCIDPRFPTLRVTTDSNDTNRGSARFSSRVAVYYGPDCGDVLGTRTIGCGQDRTNPVVFDWQPGRIYFFRVGSRDEPKVGIANVIIEHIAVNGACCAVPLGTCTAGVDANCAPGSMWMPGAVCSPNPCTVSEGACCDRGACTQTTQANCGTATWLSGQACTPTNPCPAPQDGACCDPSTGVCQIAPSAGGCPPPMNFLGAGTSCTPTNPCPQPPMGECCVGTACTVTSQAACMGTWHDGGTCTPNPCLPPMGVCCNNGACSITIQTACGGAWTTGGSCSPNPCPPAMGGCCIPATGFCSNTTMANCPGNYLGDGVACTTTLCPMPATGACCNGTTCNIRTSAACSATNGQYHGDNVACTTDLCNPPSGACCAFDGGCSVRLQSACPTGFQGNGTTCTPNPCPTTGACCIGTACTVVTAGSCVGGTFSGVGTTCTSRSCCQADINGSHGAVEPTVQDMFDYLDLWFTNDPRANVNADPSITLQDLFDYLTLYFSGCEMHPCCLITTCTLETRGGCAVGRWDTTSSACSAPTCCQADVNNSGGTGGTEPTIQDLFDYLGLWFAGDPRADINGANGVSLQDLFDYLTLYFNGCP